MKNSKTFLKISAFTFLVLIAVALFSVLLCSCDEDDETKIFTREGITYKVNYDGTTCELISIEAGIVSELDIPSVVDKYTVNSIRRSAFFQRERAYQSNHSR